jgi:hypothetical protein
VLLNHLTKCPARHNLAELSGLHCMSRPMILLFDKPAKGIKRMWHSPLRPILHIQIDLSERKWLSKLIEKEHLHASPSTSRILGIEILLVLSSDYIIHELSMVTKQVDSTAKMRGEMVLTVKEQQHLLKPWCVFRDFAQEHQLALDHTVTIASLPIKGASNTGGKMVLIMNSTHF